jgi:hypothetical protein
MVCAMRIDPMNTTKLITWLSVVLLATLSAQAQGTFQNLDFQDANLSPIPAGGFGGFVPITSALPGWTGYLGSTEVTQVLQDNYTLGVASIDILGPSWAALIDLYTVVLQPGFGNAENVSASISQTGLVPSDALSLQFKADIFSAFSVSLGGEILSLIPLGTGQDSGSQLGYTLYGANIAAFAGHVETLTITALAAPNTTDYFDSFDFSPSSVPEPDIAALTAIGGLLFGARKWFARRWRRLL